MEQGKKYIPFVIMGVIIALIITLIMVVSQTPGQALYQLLIGPLQSKRYLHSVLEESTPLMFSALALCIIFKAGIFSMIGDATFYLGGVVAAMIAITLTFPKGIHPLMMILGASVIGGLLGGIPALLRVKFHTSEIVTSLTLNPVLFGMGSCMLRRGFLDPTAGAFASIKYAETARLNLLFRGMKVSWGFFMALAVAVGMYILIYKTKLGYEIRLVGCKGDFAKRAGVNVNKVLILTQVIAGAIAAAGGAVEQASRYRRFNWQERPVYIWEGVAVALIARNNPKWIPVVAVVFGYISVGSELMSRYTDVPYELVFIIQALLTLLIAAEGVMTLFKACSIKEKFGRCHMQRKDV